MTIRKRIREYNRIALFAASLLIALGFAGFSFKAPLPKVVLIGSIVVGTSLASATVMGMIWPRWHPLLRRLAAYGSPRLVVCEVDGELVQREAVATFGQPARAFRVNNTGKFPIFVTPSWLVQFRELGFRIARLNDVISYYKKCLTIETAIVVKDRWFSVVVTEQSGRQVEFHQSEREVDQLMNELAILLPGVPGGRL